MSNISPKLFGFRKQLRWYQRWRRIPCWFGHHPNKVVCNVNLGGVPVYSATYCTLCGVELAYQDRIFEKGEGI